MIGPHLGMLFMLALLVAVFAVPCVIYVAAARHPQPRSVGLICFVVHACLVLMLAADILIGMRHSGEALTGWLLVDILDFPASLVHLGTDLMLSGTRFNTFWISNFSLPLIGGLVFGSAQWGLIGLGVAKLSLAQRHQCGNKKKRRQRAVRRI